MAVTSRINIHIDFADSASNDSLLLLHFLLNLLSPSVSWIIM